MKKVILAMRLWPLVAVCLLLFNSCDDNEEPQNGTEKVVITTQPEELFTFSASGDEQTITVSTNPPGNEWSAKESAGWIHLSPKGSSLIIKVDQNDGGDRAGTVTISAENAENVVLSVNQFAAGQLVFEVLPPELEFEAEGGEETVRVKSDTKWEAATTADWLTVTPGDTEFSVKADAYRDTEKPREAEITVRAENISTPFTVKVTQNKASEPAKLEVDREEIEFEAAGSTEVIKVTSNVQWWVLDKDLKYDWLTIEQKENQFSLTAERNENFGEPRTAELEVEGEGIDDPVIIRISQKPDIPYLRVSVEKFEPEWNSRYLPFTIESNTSWKISWDAEKFYDPAGLTSPSYWYDGNWSISNEGDLEAFFVFDYFRPMLSTESRRGEMLITSELIDEPVRIPFEHLGMPTNTNRLASIDDLIGEWDVTGEIIKLGDDFYVNDHVVSISRHASVSNVVVVENITNINSYPQIGGTQFKGDSANFMVDLENSTITLSSPYRAEQQVSVNIGNNWGLESDATATLLCANLHEDSSFILTNKAKAMRFPMMFIDVKDDGRHEIEMFNKDRSIVYNGKTYYGSCYVYGDYSPVRWHYASTFGTKWIKRP